jgi:hypothetical protein
MKGTCVRSHVSSFNVILLILFIFILFIYRAAGALTTILFILFIYRVTSILVTIRIESFKIGILTRYNPRIINKRAILYT